jgi:hypothetical protein
MTTQPNDTLNGSANSNEDQLIPNMHNNTANQSNKDITDFFNDQILSAEHTDDEITKNDGSVIETLDIDFHNQPGYVTDHSLAGSNRADYYEKRSQGMSDTEEEQEYMRNHHEE